MTTRSSAFFPNSLVLIDENDGRVLDILTQQQLSGRPNTEAGQSLTSGSSHRPAQWTSSDISLRTLNKDRPNHINIPPSEVEGIPESPNPSRFLNFRRNEDFARTLLARPGGEGGRRRTTFYTDARTSVASFFTAYDDDHGEYKDDDDFMGRENQADPSGEQDQAVVSSRGGNGHEKWKDDDVRSVVELFSIPHPDDVIPNPETLEVDIAANDVPEEAIPSTAYLDRFWTTLFPSPDKDKAETRSDGSWVVTVSMDMSKWFFDNLSTLINRTTSLLGPATRAQDKTLDGEYGFPARPVRQATDEEYNSIPLSPTTMALRALSNPEHPPREKEDGQPKSRLGLWYIEDDGTSRQIWAGGPGETGREGAVSDDEVMRKATR